MATSMVARNMGERRIGTGRIRVVFLSFLSVLHFELKRM